MSYKGLKKIINSLEALPSTSTLYSITVVAAAPPLLPPSSSPSGSGTPELHSTTNPPLSQTETGTAAGSATTKIVQGPETREMRAMKTAFFYRLERELEKVNTFYLQKESELKVRLRSLEDKKRLVASRQRRLDALSAQGGQIGGKSRVDVAALQGLREGFLGFLGELMKVQKFVDINATGFRKILKKWDKRSHTAPTKDLYLARQVEIQPVFSHRDVMAELNDRGSVNLQEVEGILESVGVGEVGGATDLAHEVEGRERTLRRGLQDGDDEVSDGPLDELELAERREARIAAAGSGGAEVSPLTAAAAHAVHEAATGKLTSGRGGTSWSSFSGGPGTGMAMSTPGSGALSAAESDFYLDLEQQIAHAARESRFKDMQEALDKRKAHISGGMGGLSTLVLPPSSFVGVSATASSTTTTSSIQKTPPAGPLADAQTRLIDSPIPATAPDIPATLTTSPPAPPTDSNFVSRMFLRLCADAPMPALMTLLESGEVDPGYRDDISDRTALHEIAIVGRLDVLRELVKYIEEWKVGRMWPTEPGGGVTPALEPSPGVRDRGLLSAVEIHNRTPLHYVAMYGHVECARLLLAHGASLEEQDLDGSTPLVHAIAGGHVEVVKTFLDHGVNVEPAQESDPVPLCLACAGGKKEIVRLLLEKGAKMNVADAEGLYPLHISARAGNAGICKLLIDRKADADSLDRYNGWTPLFYAASEGNREVVKTLLDAGVAIDVRDESGWDAAAYAVYRGHVAVGAMLRRQRGVDLQTIAQAPRSDIQVPASVSSAMGGLVANPPSPPDNNNSDHHQPITPSAFFAVPSGPVPPLIETVAGRPQLAHVSQELASPRISASANVPSLDDLPPLDDLDVLTESQVDVGVIPPLSLPPPIVPFRTYVQIKLGHRPKSYGAGVRRDPVALFGSRQLSSLKLIISAKPESGGSLPYNIILPLKDDSEVFTFLVDSFPTLQFDIYPTFGTKVIARGTLLPSTLGLISREGRGDGSGVAERCIVPLIDTHLRVVGEMCFECEIVNPFRHKGVVIGGRVDTYWKSTRVVSTIRAPSSSNFPEALATSTETWAANSGGMAVNTLLQQQPHLAVPLNSAPSVQSFVEASSLAEEYIILPVQLTRDGVPVVFPDWYVRIGGDKGSSNGSSIPISADPSFEDLEGGILVSIADISAAKFKQLGEKTSSKRRLLASNQSADGEPLTSTELVKLVHESFFTLDEVLESVSTRTGVNIEIKYPTSSQQALLKTSADRHSVNSTVDAVLKSVYGQVGKRSEQRSIIFMSSNPAVCTATNWKQPNYAVFFRTNAGYPSLLLQHLQQTSANQPGTLSDQVELLNPSAIDSNPEEEFVEEAIESDERCKSIKEAIRFARTGNLLGIVCEARPLVEVSALINTVKESGLILATFGETNSVPANVTAQHLNGVDAIVIDDVMRYSVAY
ncbi:phosphate system positive regulatory protein pho81 [Gonapodya sp. JEL0774]|nr:phosphate system positive regulatory protein pho81 [Gonapodya sp. JEL0774]